MEEVKNDERKLSVVGMQIPSSDVKELAPSSRQNNPKIVCRKCKKEGVKYEDCDCGSGWFD